jgi:hypothetical protein
MGYSSISSIQPTYAALIAITPLHTWHMSAFDTGVATLSRGIHDQIFAMTELVVLSCPSFRRSSYDVHT